MGGSTSTNSSRNQERAKKTCGKQKIRIPSGVEMEICLIPGEEEKPSLQTRTCRRKKVGKEESEGEGDKKVGPAWVPSERKAPRNRRNRETLYVTNKGNQTTEQRNLEKGSQHPSGKLQMEGGHRGCGLGTSRGGFHGSKGEMEQGGKRMK